MDLLQRSGSRLLFVTSELFDEGKIDEQHKRLLKCKYYTQSHSNNLGQANLIGTVFVSLLRALVKILHNDSNLLQAAEHISDSNELKQ